MVINFLQTRAPHPLLPSLQNWHHEPRPLINGIDVSFADDLDKYDLLKSFSALNRESIGSLLFGFFHHYAFIFDYERDVASVRLGAVISRLEKGYPSDNMFCIEEPFTTSRNLGNTADMGSHRGIHAELQKAHRLLCDGAPLSALFEPYKPRQQSTSPNRHDRNLRRGNSVSKGRQNFPRPVVPQPRHQIQQFQHLRLPAETEVKGVKAAMVAPETGHSWALGSKIEPFLNSELHIDELQRTHWQYLSEQENAILVKTALPYHFAQSGNVRQSGTTHGRKMISQSTGQPQIRAQNQLGSQRAYLPRRLERRPSPVVNAPGPIVRPANWQAQDSCVQHKSCSTTSSDDSDVVSSYSVPRNFPIPASDKDSDRFLHTAGYRSDTLSHENLLAVDASYFQPDAPDTTCSEADGSQISCGLTLASSRSSPSSMSAYPSPAVPISYSDACMAGLDLKLPPPASHFPDSPYETTSAHFRPSALPSIKQLNSSPVRATYASKVSSPVAISASPRKNSSPPCYEPFPAVRYK